MEESAVGNRIKEFRVQLTRKQSEFAEDLETTQGNISQIENGSCTPTANFFYRMYKICPDINFNWLFTGEGKLFRTQEVERLKREWRNEGELELKKEHTTEVLQLKEKIKVLEDNQQRLIHILSAK